MINRCRDSDVLDSVWKHESVYPGMSDDYTKDPELMDTEILVANNNVYILAAYVGDDLAGIFSYMPLSYTMFQVHSAVLPKFRGRNAVLLARESLLWMFLETDCKKVIGLIPSDNGPGLALAKRVGMKIEGKIKASVMRNGKLLDQTILGMAEEEFLCQQQ